MKKFLENKKGITLIALIITIIILLILAGITIGTLTGNGLFDKAKTARDKSEKSQATETMNLKITNIQISSYSEKQELPDLQYLADKLCEDNDIQYVLTTSKEHASLDKIDVTNSSSIFTKLKEYPYEFEINSSLQLASINGVKVANTNTMQIPTETIDISENGEYDIVNYAKANVHISSANENNSIIFLNNNVADSNYTLNTGNTENRSGKWEFNNKGLDLYISHNYDSSNDSDAKYTYWCYIPFRVSKTGKYLFYMNKTNQQVDTNTENPLYYGISSLPVKSRGTYNILNASNDSNLVGVIDLSSDTDYYIGANFDLTWNNWGYGKISFSDILLVYLK